MLEPATLSVQLAITGIFLKTKFVFTIGGVLSGLGKGITTASVGLLLKQKGFSVTAVKIDPYISIDAGTMRPAEHGETFVTADGGEIDQDLGNYERFLGIDLSKENNITTGKVMMAVVENERTFKYGGRDAEMIPDVIDEIKQRIYRLARDKDFCLVEIGGTTGDIENLPFLYAAREIGREEAACYILVTYLPFLRNVGELKTKPTQHAVSSLRSTGIQPDFIITRNEVPLDEPRKETIAKRCFVDRENIIDNPDTDCIYEIVLAFERERMADRMLVKFGLKKKETDLKAWKRFVRGLKNPRREIRVGLLGKYYRHGADNHRDVYLSVHEALLHAGGKLRTKVMIVPINSFELEKGSVDRIMKEMSLDGLIGPQGWGQRGTEGIIRGITFARKSSLPYLGLCYGMQLAVVEYARNVLGLKGANSAEIDSKTQFPVIHIMSDQAEILRKKQYGGTIRLGDWPCSLKRGTILRTLYGKELVQERHRHRYEVNNEYRERLEGAGLMISGTSPDGKLVEAIELPRSKHPFFVGTQFHPEYKTKVLSPHPVFVGFIKACSLRQKLLE